MKKLWVNLTLVVCGLMPATPADAAVIVAINAGGELVTFDSASPGSSTSVAISGIAAGDALQGIDLRPANNTVYGLATSSTASRLYSIDRTTGVATPSSMLSTIATGDFFGVDFNPTVDRLRVVSDTGQNLRINVDTGGTIVDTPLAFATGDQNEGTTPFVVAAAYTNSFAGATSTELYDLELNTGSLVQQVPANAGTLATIGVLQGLAFPDAAFDIFSDGATNTGFVVLDGFALNSIDLATGELTFLGEINSGSTIRDITAVAVPEPGSLALLGLVAGGAAYRRRRRAAAQ